MFERVKELRDRYAKATNDQEREQIQKETDRLREENPEAWAEAMLECMKDTNATARKMLINQQIEDIKNIVSISYIAKEYFGKTPQWFYQRLNENVVNGKPAQFTEEEIDRLNFALQDISKKIGSIRVSA